MSKFESILETLKTGIKNMAEARFKDFLDDTAKDGEEFLDSIKADLAKWADDLANQIITEAEFKSLVKGKKDLAKMKALKARGLAKAKIDQLRTDLINLVVNTVVKGIG